MAKTSQLKVFNINIWLFYRIDGLGWFRIFGIGLHWKDTSKHRLFFSERNGYTKSLKIGNWRISYLGNK